ncbi:hypothetical protein C8R45DRAFT_1032440 [Mycena sanguinolenta]|nr:hypothetical protein C8R45DRAFT_1032440 [Mycena sanguinolenta]
MSSHSPTTAGITITLSTLQDSYHHTDEDEIDKERAVSETPTFEKRSLGHQSGFAAFYRSVSWVFGFKEKYSLVNCEWFSFRPPLFKIPLFIHIYLATCASDRWSQTLAESFCSWRDWCSVPIYSGYSKGQPLPWLWLLVHRINGYGVLFCLVGAMICGSIAARRAFGGEINAQGAYYVQALLIMACGFMGFNNVKKDTRRHRKWMLRMVVYFGNVLTARLIALPTRSIITLIGTYYSIFRCDEVINLIRAPETIQGSFPQCNSTDLTSVFVAVHASVHDPPLYVASAARVAQGLSLWIATVIHILAVEFYIYQTDAANQVRLNFALEPRDFTQE